MNPSETAFLTLGLVIGVAMGATLWQVLRTRPGARREVRLTIAPNSVPARRALTLATPGGGHDHGPLPGSPDGDAFTHERLAPSPTGILAAAPAPVTRAVVRTPVPLPAGVPLDAVAVPIVLDDHEIVAVSASAVPAARRGVTTTAPVLMAAGVAAGGGRPSAGAPGTAEDAVRSTGAGAGDADGPAAAGSSSWDSAGAGSPPASGPCADERRLVDERCALAQAAGEQAGRASDAFRAAQRAYDALRERVEQAQAVADPRRIAEAKAHLHGAFRTANEAAAGPEQAEAAAREWLDQINRLNASVREATRLIEAGGAELRSQLPILDRLALEAEASRIAADNAAEGCQAAREHLAACEEAAAAAAAAVPAEPADEDPRSRHWPSEEPALPGPDALGTTGGGVPAILLLLRGDRTARERVVTAIAGADAEAQRDWNLRLASLVDAITARAIEDGYLDLPEDDPFWRMFSGRESRDIVGALSALGFRYDGMGGFADGRVPAARDLSLAVGYAGLDPMRIRSWPREDAMARLFASATVASDEWLITQAGDLSLGRMVDALGSRAAALADTWNAWGRVRPILLAD